MTKQPERADQPTRPPPDRAGVFANQRRPHVLLAAALLLLAAVLAITSLVGDSVTFDEPSKLTAGLSYLRTGDFRLAPDHPPLAKTWAALPLLLVDHQWPGADDEHWVVPNIFPFARTWLFDLNDGQQLVVIGRLMMVVLLLATCLATYGLGRELFGPAAGLLALVLAALSPTLLAHGRLIGTDVPITLCCTVVLLTFARLARGVTWPRLIAAALALAAASLTKFSWPLVLPGLVAMALVAVLRREPLPCTVIRKRAKATDATDTLPPGRHRAAVLLAAGVFVALVAWLAIWTCYCWRVSITVPSADDGPAAIARHERTAEKLGRDWQRAFHQRDGTPRRGLLPALLRFGVDNHVLPDAYLFGLAMTMESTSARPAYLLGEYSETGWCYYFPVALAIKTPLPTLLLLLLGLLTLARRQARCQDTALLVGAAVFTVVYCAYLVGSRFNIGIRHLLPVYPVLFAIGGAAAAWLTRRGVRWIVIGAIVWLAGANLQTYPHYLSYFNESIGGPVRGHLRLADSNIDWGQDLLRLADYAQQHPDERIKLAYFGSAIPTRYVECTALPSHYDFEPRAALTGGTYVISVTQLLGVYTPGIRGQTPPYPRDAWQVRAERLIGRLRRRPWDQRIGHSLLVYRLSETEAEQLARQP